MIASLSLDIVKNEFWRSITHETLTSLYPLPNSTLKKKKIQERLSAYTKLECLVIRLWALPRPRLSAGRSQNRKSRGLVPIEGRHNAAMIIMAARFMQLLIACITATCKLWLPPEYLRYLYNYTEGSCFICKVNSTRYLCEIVQLKLNHCQSYFKP